MLIDVSDLKHKLTMNLILDCDGWETFEEDLVLTPTPRPLPKFNIELLNELRVIHHAFRKRAIKKASPSFRISVYDTPKMWKTATAYAPRRRWFADDPYSMCEGWSFSEREVGENFCSFQPSKMKLKSIQKELRN